MNGGSLEEAFVRLMNAGVLNAAPSSASKVFQYATAAVSPPLYVVLDGEDSVLEVPVPTIGDLSVSTGERVVLLRMGTQYVCVGKVIPGSGTAAVVQIEDGGTGATTAEQARKNLGILVGGTAPASGEPGSLYFYRSSGADSASLHSDEDVKAAQNDVVLSLDKGGTGASTVAGALRNIGVYPALSVDGADEGSVVVQVPAGTSLPSVSKTDPGTGSGFVLPVSLGGTGRNTPEGVRQLFNIYVGDSEPPAGLPVGSVYLRRRGM